ncbi:MAG TPA: ABC transporter ATP-binding protein [Bryobacteraceae bacterium]|nr:ABC transporter ATP-binding protein [Bryobacteraceae bacterium]
MSRRLIEVRDLRFRYHDGTPALNGVDFWLDARETVALLGPNGSGKTTFVLHLNGLLSGEGTIEICGVPLTKETLSHARRKIGLVFQDSDSQLFMPTVIEDAAFGPLNLGLTGDEAMERAREALAQVGMAAAENRAPWHLSAGEKKRVAIAGILAMRPEILILDEPTTFLDPPAAAALLQLLRELPQAKIVVTHDVLFAGAVAPRAVFFEKGAVVGEGTVPDVLQRFGWSGPLTGLRTLP